MIEMMTINKITLAAVLVIAFSNHVLAQADYCHVLMGWEDLQTKRSTSVYDVGHFCPDTNPDNSPVIKTFVHEESGIKVKVGVEYWTQFSDINRLKIRMGMTLDDKEENNVFFSINSAYADTFRDRHWRLLHLQKRIIKNGKYYIFEFECFKQTGQSQKIYKCNH
jgi:hypothetical protein